VELENKFKGSQIAYSTIQIGALYTALDQIFGFGGVQEIASIMNETTHFNSLNWDKSEILNVRNIDNNSFGFDLI